MKRAIVGVLLVLAALIALLLLPLPWPAGLVGTRIDNTIDIAAPMPQVFAYVATPANWPRWHPASRAVRGVTDHTPAVGESVIETYEIGGRRDEATWTTVELEPPLRWRFVARAEAGGTAEIAYTFTPTATGTRFRRELFYRGPNLAFAIVDRFKLRDIMTRDSAAALENVKRDTEGRASSAS
jgi:uncharacterized protein YndB with AHSA1/START domain